MIALALASALLSSSLTPLASAAVAGTSCKPTAYTGNACQGFINWQVDTLAADVQQKAESFVQQNIGLANQLQSNKTCVQALIALACGAYYPQCIAIPGGSPVLQVPCKDSCDAAVAYCTPTVQQLGLPPAILLSSVQNCVNVSSQDQEPLGKNGVCLDTALLAGIGSSTGGVLNLNATGSSTSSGNGSNSTTVSCPSFFLPQTGPNNKNCNGKTKCCAPCPIQNYIYPNNQFDIVVLVTQISSFLSALLAAYVVLSWSTLPGRRQHPGDIVLHFTIAVMIWQACALFLVGNPRRIQCADEVTVSSASNNLLCGIQGAILMCAVHATIFWGSYMMFNLHATIVWRSNFFERFKPLGVTICWGMPGVLTFIPFLAASVDAVTGVTCIISADKGNLFFFSFQAVLIIPAFILNTSTMIHIMIVARRQTNGSSNVSGGYSSNGYSGNGEKPMSNRRQILHLLKLNWRALGLGLLFIVTYTCYIIFFNTVVVPLATTDASTPWVMDWVTCNAIGDATAGTIGAAKDDCARKFASNIPSLGLAVISAAVVSTTGLWIFFIFGFNLQLIYDWMNWFEDLRYGRRNQEQQEPEWR